METTEQTESLIVDYIKLSQTEFNEIKYKLLAISDRLDQIDHKQTAKFFGREKGYEPITITIESEVFVWNFSVIVDEPEVPTGSGTKAALSNQ